MGSELDLDDVAGRSPLAMRELAELRGEIKRLVKFLKSANDQAEHFEREWYLRGDELEALQARIDGATRAIMDTRDVLGICAPTEEDFPALYALAGKRVALVIVE